MTREPEEHAAVPAEEELTVALAEGRLRFHELPKSLPQGVAARIRRRALERMTQGSLAHVGHFSFDPEVAARRNCENLIGAAQIPMGIVGPLPVRGDVVSEDVLVPMATTEGALIASVNRGCAALRAAGGGRVRVEEAGMSRGPVFRSRGLDETQRFLEWLRTHEEEIRKVTESTSRFLKLLEVKSFTFGTSIFLRFSFDAGDAMGMNMATIACDRAVRELIEPATGVECVALSGNYCVDKKPAAVNFHEGRGKRIFAEVVLSDEVLRDQLKTGADSLVEVQYRKNLLGSIAAGAKGFNAHFANILAALFVATGQDLAHVVEGAVGVTCIERWPEGGAHFSVFLPDVPLGAIGGGTGLGTQSEALRLLGVVADPEHPGLAVRRLAEIVGSCVLAGEVSLMAALTSHDLADAHQRLGRSGAGATTEAG